MPTQRVYTTGAGAGVAVAVSPGVPPLPPLMPRSLLLRTVPLFLPARMLVLTFMYCS